MGLFNFLKNLIFCFNTENDNGFRSIVSTDTKIIGNEKKKFKGLMNSYHPSNTKNNNALSNLYSNDFTEKPLLALDLRGTLVDIRWKEQPNNTYEEINYKGENGRNKIYYVSPRPHLNQILASLKEKYQLILLSVSAERFTLEVLEKLNLTEFFSGWHGRKESCKGILDKNGRPFYTKNPEIFKRYKGPGFTIVDDHRYGFLECPENGIQIKTYKGDPNDEELLKLVDILDNGSEIPRN